MGTDTPAATVAPQKRWWRWGFESTWPVWVSVAVRIALVLFLLMGGGSWVKNRIAPASISADELQSTIVTAFNERMANAGADTRASDATCEGPLKEQKDKIVLCDLYTNDSGTLQVQVTAQDSDGHYLWQVMG